MLEKLRKHSLKIFLYNHNIGRQNFRVGIESLYDIVLKKNVRNYLWYYQDEVFDSGKVIDYSDDFLELRRLFAKKFGYRPANGVEFHGPIFHGNSGGGLFNQHGEIYVFLLQ